MKMPLKLERLVHECYGGNVVALGEETRQYAEKLRELQKELYERLEGLPSVHNPLEHVHNLRKRWSEERVERLGQLGGALLDYDSEKELLSAVQKSLVYTKRGDLYALPFDVHLNDASSAFYGGMMLRALSMLLPPMARKALTVAGAVGGYTLAKTRRQVENPFEELGKKMEQRVRLWLPSQKNGRDFFGGFTGNDEEDNGDATGESYEDALERLKRRKGE